MWQARALFRRHSRPHPRRATAIRCHRRRRGVAAAAAAGVLPKGDPSGFTSTGSGYSGLLGGADPPRRQFGGSPTREAAGVECGVAGGRFLDGQLCSIRGRRGNPNGTHASLQGGSCVVWRCTHPAMRLMCGGAVQRHGTAPPAQAAAPRRYRRAGVWVAQHPAKALPPPPPGPPPQGGTRPDSPTPALGTAGCWAAATPKAVWRPPRLSPHRRGCWGRMRCSRGGGASTASCSTPPGKPPAATQSIPRGKLGVSGTGPPTPTSLPPPAANPAAGDQWGRASPQRTLLQQGGGAAAPPGTPSHPAAGGVP